MCQASLSTAPGRALMRAISSHACMLLMIQTATRRQPNVKRRQSSEIPPPEGPAIENKSISIENFNPGVAICGALLVYRKWLDRIFQSTIDRLKFSIPKAAMEIFAIPGPSGPKSQDPTTVKGTRLENAAFPQEQFKTDLKTVCPEKKV